MLPIPVDKALVIVLRAAPVLASEVTTLPGAEGRILGEVLHADHDYPPFDKALMDGYAMVGADLDAPPRQLKIKETIHAGHDPGSLRLVEPGSASRIMTGAPVPPGADAVIPVEETEASPGGQTVLARASVRAGANLARRGDDARAGDLLLEPGEFIGPAEIAVLAACGRTRVHVGGRPRVAVLATGDELVDPDRRPAPGQIRNSNGPLLAALVRRMGLLPIDLGIAPDEPEALRERLRVGLENDLLIVSGGVSMGEKDLVAGVLRSLGVTILFDRVAIKPGKPFTFGTKGPTLVFACPGNPVSTYVIVQLFARAALRRMMGFPEPSPPVLRGRLETELRQRGGRTGYHQARAHWRGNHYSVAILPSSGSADFVSCARGNALAVIPAETSALAAGAEIDLILLDDYADR